MSDGIQSFYRGKTIFITGGSGFMGKVLIEKLLYSCSEIEEILILLRPKRGKSAQERLEDFSKIPVFQRICKEKPEMFEKLVPVYGDITSPRLGLSDEHYMKVISTVHVVFHMAASLKLEATLKPNVEMNLTGTKHVMDVCKQMPNLKAVLHLSTAFCNCDQEVLREEVYEWPQKPLDLIQCTEWMTETAMEVLGRKLIAPHPNTYTYTKRLSEILVRDEHPNLPICIVRPSIVTPSYKEPMPGWVDSLNGPIGIMVAGGKGVLRTMLCEADFEAEVIPVDKAINGIIGIAYTLATMKSKPRKIPVYNLTCSENKRMNWGTVLDEGKRLNYEYPFEAGLWYPNGNVTMNLAKHYTTLFFCQWIPALLIDFLMLIFFQPRFMIRVQKKIYTGLGVLQFFTTRRWNFESDNFKKIHELLSPEEKIVFNSNTEDVDEIEYLKSCILGGRQYCLKEPLSTLRKARIQLIVLRVLDFLFKAFWIYVIGKCFFDWTGMTETINEILMERQATNSS